MKKLLLGVTLLTLLASCQKDEYKMGVVNGLATSFSPAETKEFKNLVEDATVVDVTIDGKPQKAVIFKKDLIGKKFPYEQMVHTKVGGIQGMICSCSFPVIDRE